MGAEPGTMGMDLPFFVAVWVGMMAAMMLPALGPAAATGSPTLGRVVAFGAGFLVPWAAYGAAAFAAFAASSRLVDASPATARWVGVGILAVAGVFQLSSWKIRAITHCRMAHQSGDASGITGRLVAGISDGAVCVGCCWALMAILIAVGAMNIAAMAGLAVVIFAEKVLPAPRLIARIAGVVLLALAVVAAVHPAILHGLTPTDMGSGMPMGGM
jgi:predicted metal-binding membrane protein